MDINITFRHTDSSPALRTHIEDKLKKMAKYTIKPIKAHVTLTVESSEHIAEITLLEDHHNLAARGQSENMWDSANEALSKLRAQLVRVKEKTKSHH